MRISGVLSSLTILLLTPSTPNSPSVLGGERHKRGILSYVAPTSTGNEHMGCEQPSLHG